MSRLDWENEEENKNQDKPDIYNAGNDDELPAFLSEKEGLLNSFLDNIAINQTPSKTVLPQDVNNLQNIPSDVFAALAMPAHLEQKIVHLRQISEAIEKKNLDLQVLGTIDFSKFKVKYPNCLNPAQLAGVVLTEKPILCIAGAGSGKTRVIVHRVAYLIEKGIDPQSILLLTFTRKAAHEMLHRVETLLKDKNVSKVTGGTFHSFASFVLRKYSNMLQLPTNFTIIDNGDSEDIIDLIRSELKFNSKDKRFPKKGRIFDIISYSRNKQMSIAEIIKKQYSGLEMYIPAIELLYSGYTKYKKISQILDFDDLLDVLNESLKKNQRFREAMQNAYQYVMVDEFQDTNVVQNEIVNQIADKHHRIMVVGDDSQSIYAFRGAEYENILRFPETYPDCLVVKIEENYRSNQYILDFTNSIIDNALVGYKKKLYTKNKYKHLPVVKRTYNQEDEAIFIVDRIVELNEQGVAFDQMAVLNRADWHNRYIQAELNKRGIPYVVVGGFRFNERMHIRDVVAYLRLTFNPADAVSWHRVLKYIGGIGQVTASSLVASLQRLAGNFEFEAFKQRKFYQELLQLGQMLSKASHPELTLTQKIEIIRDYYAPLLKAREEDYLSRMQDVEVLIDLSRKYRSLDNFLSDFALDPPSNRIADQSRPFLNEGEEAGKVTISTVHSAKGLEWYAVFIPHALDGMLPSNRATNVEEMEEERRLLYVACSRAKEELYITFPRNVFAYDAFFHLPSRFLIGIDREKYIFEF